MESGNTGGKKPTSGQGNRTRAAANTLDHQHTKEGGGTGHTGEGTGNAKRRHTAAGSGQVTGTVSSDGRRKNEPTAVTSPEKRQGMAAPGGGTARPGAVPGTGGRPVTGDGAHPVATGQSRNAKASGGGTARPGAAPGTGGRPVTGNGARPVATGQGRNAKASGGGTARPGAAPGTGDRPVTGNGTRPVATGQDRNAKASGGGTARTGAAPGTGGHQETGSGARSGATGQGQGLKISNGENLRTRTSGAGGRLESAGSGNQAAKTRMNQTSENGAAFIHKTVNGQRQESENQRPDKRRNARAGKTVEGVRQPLDGKRDFEEHEPPQAAGKKFGLLSSRKSKRSNKDQALEKKKKRENEFKISYIIDSLEKASEALQQINGIKADYQTVTDYLMDVEKLDQLTAEERQDLERAAENVHYYEKELEKCKDKESHITSEQRITMAKYEASVNKELKDLRENEEYGRLVHNDMRHLETEKGYLLYEREEIVIKQGHLKKIAIVTATFVLSLFALVAAVAFALELDMTIPYLLTITLAAGSMLAIFMEANKNRRMVQLNEKKLWKAVNLLNHVKIKYVNNQNVVDYICGKYGIRSAEELDYVYKQYRIWKDKEEKYQRYTERLLTENNELIQELDKLQLSDTEGWVKHAKALVDRREMVEVRHDLNLRRQNLRSELDRCMKIYKQSLLIVQKAEQLKPALHEEIMQLLKQYGIDTSIC